jgi:hypothetical protein
MTDELSGPAREALRILAMHPELGTPEAMNQKAIQQVGEADLRAGLRELEGLGLAQAEYGFWKLTATGREKAGRA